MKDKRQKTGSHDSLHYKIPHIKELEANQIIVDTSTETIADQYLIATSAQKLITNRAYDSKRLQQNIREQAAKFVQNVDIQKQAKKQ